MAQYIYTMNNVSKLVPPKREILKKILTYRFSLVPKLVFWVLMVQVNQPCYVSWQA